MCLNKLFTLKHVYGSLDVISIVAAGLKVIETDRSNCNLY